METWKCLALFFAVDFISILDITPGACSEFRAETDVAEEDIDWSEVYIKEYDYFRRMNDDSFYARAAEIHDDSENFEMDLISEIEKEKTPDLVRAKRENADDDVVFSKEDIKAKRKDILKKIKEAHPGGLVHTIEANFTNFDFRAVDELIRSRRINKETTNTPIDLENDLRRMFDGIPIVDSGAMDLQRMWDDI